MANKLTNIRRPVKRPNPVILKTESPLRQEEAEDYLHPIRVTTSSGDVVERTFRIRPLALKDCGPVFDLGDEVFSKIGATLSRTWDEYEVVNAFSSDVEYSGVAELVDEEDDRESADLGEGSGVASAKSEGSLAGRNNFNFDSESAGGEAGEDPVAEQERNRRKARKAMRGEERKLIGFVLGYTMVKKRENVAYVSWIGVSPTAQRMGVGTIMLKWLQDRVSRDGCARIIADTPDDNLPAIRFFEKHGFSNRIPQAFLWCNVKPDVEPTVPTQAVLAEIGNREVENAEEDKKAREELQKLREETQKRLVVRRMEVQDLYPVYKLGNRSYTEDVFWEESEIVELFQTDADSCFVAIDQNKLIGFALGSTVEKRENGAKVSYGYLIWMAVEKAYHRLGVGLLLYNRFFKVMEAGNVNAVLVDTTLNNKAALGFFKKLGFVQTSTHYFYSKPLDSSNPQ